MSALVRVSRVLPAAREEVFRAWTDPELFAVWFKPRGGSIPSAELDVRVGGRFRIAIQRLGYVYYAVGEYLEVDPPARLVSTFAWERVPLVHLTDNRLTVEFVARGDDETEVVITHERLDTRVMRTLHAWGWRSTLAQGARRRRGATTRMKSRTSS